MAHQVAAKSRDHDVVTYWHSKGVSRYSDFDDYLRNEKAGPLEGTMAYPLVRRMFAVLPNLAMWSYLVGERSQPIPWCNIWSTRAERLKALGPPRRTGQRHYYETYLGDLPLKPHEITISPCPVTSGGGHYYVPEVGFQCSRPESWK